MKVNVKVKEQTPEEQNYISFGGLSDIVFDKNGSICAIKVRKASKWDYTLKARTDAGYTVKMILLPAIRS